MAKSKEKIEARRLRKEGKSIKNIAQLLHVSSSTISIWCRDVELTASQILQLEKQAHDPQYGKRLTYSLAQKTKKNDKIAQLHNLASSEIGILSRRDLFIAGISLYWAEGFKKDNMVGFANTDPKMILFFLKWVNECLMVESSQIRLRVGINEHQKSRTSEIENYWSKITNISLLQFKKPFYQKVLWKKVYENENDYHGTLRIRLLKSTDLLRKIQGYILALHPNE